MTVAAGNNIKNSRMLLSWSIGFCLLLPVVTKAQEFPELGDYKHWGLHFDKVWYLPAKADRKYGVYDIDTKLMPSIGFGFEYIFKPQNTWSFVTGLDMDFLPFANYTFFLPQSELPSYSQDQFPNGFNGGGLFPFNLYTHSVFAIPIGVNIKQKIIQNVLWNFTASVSTKIMFSGGWESGSTISDIQTSQSTILFKVNGYTNPRTFLYPSANLNVGLSFMSKYALIRLDAKFQKTIFPFFKGEYRIYNLKNTPDTYGTYKVQGDYFGLGITVTPRKIKTLKY